MKAETARDAVDAVLRAILVGTSWAHPDHGEWKAKDVNSTNDPAFPSRIMVTLSGPGPCRGVRYVDGLELAEGRHGWIML